MAGREYPARMVSLPCNVEAFTALDGGDIVKGADVSQMLIVYEVRHCHVVC